MINLEVKKQKAKNDWLFLRINPSKQGTRDFLIDSNTSSKMWRKYLQVLKQQESFG